MVSTTSFGIDLGERVVQGRVAVGGDVALDAFGVDDAAVGEHDRLLFGEERCLRVGLFDVGLAALERGDDGRGVLGGDVDVEGLVRVDLHQRAVAAEFHAADAAHLDLVVRAGLGDGLFEVFLDALGVGRHAAGGHAATQDDFFARGEFLLLDLLEVVKIHGATHFLIWSKVDSGVWRGVTVPS